MSHQHPVTIIMVEDDEGHARLIEKNIRRAGVCNEIRHFTSGTAALDQPAEPRVVVDVEDAPRIRWGESAHGASGIWITDRNRPSWRMACENDSYSTGFVM